MAERQHIKNKRRKKGGERSLSLINGVVQVWLEVFERVVLQ